jgi:hypothetical protein
MVFPTMLGSTIGLMHLSRSAASKSFAAEFIKQSSNRCHAVASVHHGEPPEPTAEEEHLMRRTLVAVLAILLATVTLAAPAGAKEFGTLFAEGETFRTFGNPAHVDPGTGTDPIFTFENSTNPDQLSVAQYAPGAGSHGGRWAVHHATWTASGDPGTLVTSYDQLQALVDAGDLTVVRDEAADFRCPIIPNA